MLWHTLCFNTNMFRKIRILWLRSILERAKILAKRFCRKWKKNRYDEEEDFVGYEAFNSCNHPDRPYKKKGCTGR